MNERETRIGLWFGLAAFGLWGFIPLFFKLLKHVPPIEILSYRVWWSALLLFLVLATLRRLPALKSALRDFPVMRNLAVSTLLIGVNWFTYIYSVSSDQLLQSSLGYYITPLANVALGFLFLGERLRPWQLVGIGLAAVGVLHLTWQGGQLPWIALVLAASFSLYGLVRKTTPVDGLVGLSIETWLLTPLAVGFLLYLNRSQTGHVDAAFSSTWWMLAASGAVTAVPLLCFVGAARRLRMATLGVLQFLAPSLQFGVAVFLFHEPMSTGGMVSFLCIWSAVAIYSLDSLLSGRRREAGESLGLEPVEPAAEAVPPSIAEVEAPVAVEPTPTALAAPPTPSCCTH